MRLVALASILMSCIAIFTGMAFSQETLGLQQAIDIALKQNPNLLAVRYESDAARANSRGARALANPEIIITPSISGKAGSDEELSVSQPLEINGQRQIRGRIARAEAEAAGSSAHSVERDIIRSVKQAYWDIAQTRDIVDLNAENVKFMQSLYDAAKRQVDVGSAPGAQAIKAEVELSRARQSLASAESELAKAKATLNTVMGRAPETDFTLSDALAFTPLTSDAQQLISIAAANRPEIAEAQAILSARRGEVQAAKALWRPDLAIQARRETFGGEGGMAIGITIPIIDWGSVRQKKKQAESEVSAQGQRLEAVQNGVSLDVQTAILDIHRAEAQVNEYNHGLLSQSERLAELAWKGYQAGATGYLEVLEAQRTLRSVRAEYYTALADHLKALAQLEWAVGMDLSELTLREEEK